MPTQILFGISYTLRHNLPMVLLGVGLAVLVGRSYVRSSAGRRNWERWRMRVPLAGKALRMVAITRFCRILGTMLANGVPILQALAISRDATGSALMASSIEEAAENVRAGAPLAEPLRKSRLFPPEIVEMIAIGEESNQLEKVLVQIADTVERRTNRQVDQAVRLIEPLILILLAGIIAFVAVGLLYPVFTMGQNI
jgi:general secretion pathway protein F/type IV pilus assembly protein PilC